MLSHIKSHLYNILLERDNIIVMASLKNKKPDYIHNAHVIRVTKIPYSGSIRPCSITCNNEDYFEILTFLILSTTDYDDRLFT